jgi:hypothetical protein
MAGPDGFTTDPEKLHSAATQFGNAGDAVMTKHTALTPALVYSPSVFGDDAVGRRFAAAYSARSLVLDGILTNMRTRLMAASVSLGFMSANYHLADQSSSGPLAQGGRIQAR